MREADDGTAGDTAILRAYMPVTGEQTEEHEGAAMNELSTLASRINEAHQECEKSAATALSHAIECGKGLTEAKAAVPHGQWLTWLSENCPSIATRTAQVYMRIARNAPVLEANAQRAALLTVRDALEYLAEPQDPFERLRLLTEGSREELAAIESRLDELLAREVTEENRAATLHELQDVASKAEAIQNRIAEARLRADRAAGEMLNDAGH